MTHRQALAWLVVASAAAAAIGALDAVGAPLGPLRIVSGAFLAFVAPGAALLAALRAPFLAGIARAVLAVPVSLGILALLGVVLDRTPAGVTPSSMAIVAGAVTAVLLLLAVVRDGRSHRGDVAVAGGLARLARAGISHVRDPLFRNAYALGLSGVITSGLGVVYWAVAARAYPTDVVGVNAALLSLVTLLANVAQLNLRSGFGRFLPIAGTRTASLVAGGYVLTTVIAAVAGLLVVALLASNPALLPDVELTPALAVLFPLTVVLWTVFTVQDHVLVGLRRTTIVPVENGVFALAKVVLLVPFAALFAGYGILVSWLLPTAAGVAIVTGWILLRLVPRRQRAAAAGDASQQAVVAANDIVRWVGADYVGSLFAIGSTAILPVIVLSSLGAGSSAHWYMVSLISMATQLVPSVLATSLLVEVAASSASFEADGSRVLRQLAVLLGPIVLVLVLFADPILSIFGPGYAAEGATALRLMALAGIPFALINIAFIRLRIEGRVRVVVAAQVVLALLLVVPAILVLPVLGITGLGIVVLAAHVVVATALTASELRPLLARSIAFGRPFTAPATPTPAAPPPHTR
jgi:O-antigen/teichoic acid export membrane protein